MHLYIREQPDREGYPAVYELRSRLCIRSTAERFHRRYIPKVGYVDIVVGNHESRIRRLRRSCSPTNAMSKHTPSDEYQSGGHTCTPTLSPMDISVTSSPSATTIPAPSCPPLEQVSQMSNVRQRRLIV